MGETFPPRPPPPTSAPGLIVHGSGTTPGLAWPMHPVACAPALHPRWRACCQPARSGAQCPCAERTASHRCCAASTAPTVARRPGAAAARAPRIVSSRHPLNRPVPQPSGCTSLKVCRAGEAHQAGPAGAAVGHATSAPRVPSEPGCEPARKRAASPVASLPAGMTKPPAVAGGCQVAK